MADWLSLQLRGAFHSPIHTGIDGRMNKLWVGMYVAAVAALAACGWAIWRMRCEGFDCMGIGLAWIAWVAGFVLVLCGGALACSRAPAATGLGRAARAAWWAQLAMGALAVGAWVVKRMG